MLDHYLVDPTLPLPLPKTLKNWSDLELRETHKQTKRRDLKDLIRLNINSK